MKLLFSFEGIRKLGFARFYGKTLVALMQVQIVLYFLICEIKITLAFCVKYAYNSSCPSFL